MLWLGRWRRSAWPEHAALSMFTLEVLRGPLWGEGHSSLLESWRNRASPLGWWGVEAGRGGVLSVTFVIESAVQLELCVEQDLNQNAGRVSVTRISTPGPRVRVVR